VKIVAAGFITGIIPDPNSPGVMFIRTDIGGADPPQFFAQFFVPADNLTAALNLGLRRYPRRR
jgi:hypothetical protein